MKMMRTISSGEIPRKLPAAGTAASLTQNCPRVLMCWDLRRASSSLSIKLFPWTTAALFTKTVTSPTWNKEAWLHNQHHWQSLDVFARRLYHFIMLLQRFFSCICLFLMVHNLYARREREENQSLAYLFSNHFGLLVNLLAIGHITNKVMALCSRQSDFFRRFFEALLRSAPQDHLADSRKLSVWKLAGKYWPSEATCSLKDKTGCVCSPLWTKHCVWFAQFSGNEAMKIIVQQRSFIQRTARPFSLQQIVFEED